MLVVNYLVEGLSDRVVAERLLTTVGAMPGIRVDAGGKPKLDPKVAGLNRASSQHGPWLVLRDLDHDDSDAVAPWSTT